MTALRMQDEIAEMAARIWRVLDAEDRLRLPGLYQKFSVKESRDIFWMALGWLVYQGYVCLYKDEGESWARLTAPAEREFWNYEEPNQDCTTAYRA